MNAKPLTWGLPIQGIECVYEAPSRLASMLESGEIAAGMVSTVACFMNPSLQIVPGISISCEGPAESVKFFYKDDLSQVRRVALDTSSLTSIVLARIILREGYNLSPEFVPMLPDLTSMMDACDAAVTIGDTTMCAPAGRWGELDLGEEWHVLTGLPFVFAVWAVNPELTESGLVDALDKSKELGLKSLREISVSESERLGLPVDVCYRYLSETMNYDLTDRHMTALRLFCERARGYGFVSSPCEVRMFADE
jgi:chorismate dehydratase